MTWSATRPIVEISGLSKSYARGDRALPVLKDVSLRIEAGEFVALMGPSGSGKSTLLNLIAGFDRPTSGMLVVAGRDLGRATSKELARWRARHVGFVFQLYNLLPVLTARENVELPLLLTDLSRAERRRRAETALGLVGLSDRLDHLPHQLSGGQEQRVAIARAIVTSPAVLLCDEPTGDLDRASGDAVLDLLSVLVSEHKTTVLMVTHDPHAAERASALLHLEKGVLKEAVERPVQREARA
jgi:putative ABC transport system ATP-binding protein